MATPQPAVAGTTSSATTGTSAPRSTITPTDRGGPAAGGLDPACLEGTWVMQRRTLDALLLASFPRLPLAVTDGGISLSFTGPMVVATARYTVELPGVVEDLVFANDVGSTDRGTWSVTGDVVRLTYTEREGGGSAFHVAGPDDDEANQDGDPPVGLYLSADLAPTAGGTATCTATALTFRVAGDATGADAVDVGYERAR